MEKLKINEKIRDFLISEIENSQYSTSQYLFFNKFISNFTIEQLKDACYTILILKNECKIKSKFSKEKKEKDDFLFHSELLEIYYNSAINILALYER